MVGATKKAEKLDLFEKCKMLERVKDSAQLPVIALNTRDVLFQFPSFLTLCILSLAKMELAGHLNFKLTV